VDESGQAFGEIVTTVIELSCDTISTIKLRWRSQEGAKGRAVKRRMNAHYAEAVLLMPTTWLGSYVL